MWFYHILRLWIRKLVLTSLSYDIPTCESPPLSLEIINIVLFHIPVDFKAAVIFPIDESKIETIPAIVNLDMSEIFFA